MDELLEGLFARPQQPKPRASATSLPWLGVLAKMRYVATTYTLLILTDAKLQSAQSTLTLLVRGGLLISTTVIPFLVTSYHSKTPMFFLPPAAAGTREGSTWFGPIGWVLSLAAAPAGEHSTLETSAAPGPQIRRSSFSVVHALTTFITL